MSLVPWCGVIACSGLSGSRVGDLVEIVPGPGAEKCGLGAVLSLEEKNVRIGLLGGAARKSSQVRVLPQTYQEGAGLEALLADISGRCVDPLGAAWPIPDQASGQEPLALRGVLSTVVRGWRSWGRKLSDHSAQGTSGVVWTGIGVIDSLAPLRRGGSLVLSGPSSAGKLELAISLARAHQGCAEVGRKRRTLFVSLGQSEAGVARTSALLGLDDASSGTEKTTPGLTLLCAPTSMTKPASSVFLRALTPIVALELGQWSAQEYGEDVLVVVEEMTSLVAATNDVQGALVRPLSKAPTEREPSPPPAAAAAARRVCGSVLDRAGTFKSGGSLSVLVLAHSNDEDAESRAVTEALDGLADAFLSLSPPRAIATRRKRPETIDEVKRQAAARKSEKGEIFGSAKSLQVDWPELLARVAPPPAFASGNAPGGLHMGLVVASGALRQLLQSSSRDLEGLELAARVGIHLEEEDPARKAGIDRGVASRELLVASSAAAAAANPCLATQSLAAVLCALAELDESFAEQGGVSSVLENEAPWKRVEAAFLEDPDMLASVEQEWVLSRPAVIADPVFAASLASKQLINLANKRTPAFAK
eukprot:CAMPEP_0172640502 /NCGR_PEP_ID=MMETSP1068-20121228/223328_1 /TAXON_ID=35684 /ORGANISM="Pseudopedinella elastica, Strain CCMP716" /LENGTH=590 /DNA_ID=CAMNT_0013453903 /DNA_START=8 /DNA_END=1780 /DNA_ORIENTATION=-